MDRPNHPTNHRIVQRLMRTTGCMSCLTEPLEEDHPGGPVVTESDPAEDVAPAAPDMIVRYQ